MEFRLTRLILIDSYCRNRIAELDVRGHITINGENGAGKTTLLRLLPMFFGESPSRIIRGDAVTEKFGRYYFPTTASYLIFEYQRRNSMALAVIHADGQSDGVVYRFIDSEFRPELFKLVQHPFCKFFGCWFCAAVLAGALRACSARGAEDGTAARRNIDRPYPQAISSGHSYLYPRRNRQHGTTRRTSPSGGGFCGAAE